MATTTATDTALHQPRALNIPHSRSAAPPRQSQPTVLTQQPARAPAGLDADGDVVGLAGGSGILLIQLCALIPGLLPCLLLAAVLALPLVIPVLALGIVVGIPVGLWRLGRRLLGFS
jgi:hypothetical protein